MLVGKKEGLAVFDTLFGRVEGGEEGGQGGVFFWLERWREGGREGYVSSSTILWVSVKNMFLKSPVDITALPPSLPPSLPP